MTDIEIIALKVKLNMLESRLMKNAISLAKGGEDILLENNKTGDTVLATSIQYLDSALTLHAREIVEKEDIKYYTFFLYDILKDEAIAITYSKNKGSKKAFDVRYCKKDENSKYASFKIYKPDKKSISDIKVLTNLVNGEINEKLQRNYLLAY